jgi:N-acetylglucosamine kinase-like BadF-type ATPase
VNAIGIDAGASKTTGVLVDRNGVEIARTRAGGANLVVSPLALVARNLRSALEPLLARGDVRAVCVGAAGAGRDEQVELLRELLRPLLSPETTLTIVHDGVIALRAAIERRPSMVVIAGTGSLVYGERADGVAVRAGGYGMLVGDDGSAFSIGRAALQHAARVLDGVEIPSALADAIVSAYGAAQASDLSRHFKEDGVSVAGVVGIVGAAHRSGDAQARRIVDEQGGRLAELALRVARLIRYRDEALPVAFTGGAFSAIPALADIVRRALQAAGLCEVTRAKIDAPLGAARIALETLPQT